LWEGGVIGEETDNLRNSKDDRSRIDVRWSIWNGQPETSSTWKSDRKNGDRAEEGGWMVGE